MGKPLQLDRAPHRAHEPHVVHLPQLRIAEPKGLPQADCQQAPAKGVLHRLAHPKVGGKRKRTDHLGQADAWSRLRISYHAWFHTSSE